MTEGSLQNQYAIVFVDISGSTALYEKVGDHAAHAQIGAHLQKITTVITGFRGTVIKHIGDEIMCRFDKPADAVLATCEIHELMERQTDVSGVPLRVRIGLHFGPALLKDNDLFGDAVNVAARVAALAQSQQTLTTDATVAALPPAEAAMTRMLHHAPVKGKQEALVLHEVLWRQENLTLLRSSRMQTLGAHDRLVLTYQGTTKIIEAGTGAFTIGRDIGCSLPIDSTVASRLHGKIEHRMGKFVYTDHSANGSYVRMPDIENLFVNREQLPLFGTGVIACGEKIKDGSPHLIHFACE